MVTSRATTNTTVGIMPDIMMDITEGTIMTTVTLTYDCFHMLYIVHSTIPTQRTTYFNNITHRTKSVSYIMFHQVTTVITRAVMPTTTAVTTTSRTTDTTTTMTTTNRTDITRINTTNPEDTLMVRKVISWPQTHIMVKIYAINWKKNVLSNARQNLVRLYGLYLFRFQIRRRLRQGRRWCSR